MRIQIWGGVFVVFFLSGIFCLRKSPGESPALVSAKPQLRAPLRLEYAVAPAGKAGEKILIQLFATAEADSDVIQIETVLPRGIVLVSGSANGVFYRKKSGDKMSLKFAVIAEAEDLYYISYAGRIQMGEHSLTNVVTIPLQAGKIRKARKPEGKIIRQGRQTFHEIPAGDK